MFLCALYVRDATVIPRNGRNEAFCVLFPMYKRLTPTTCGWNSKGRTVCTTTVTRQLPRQNISSTKLLFVNTSVGVPLISALLFNWHQCSGRSTCRGPSWLAVLRFVMQHLCVALDVFTNLGGAGCVCVWVGVRLGVGWGWWGGDNGIFVTVENCGFHLLVSCLCGFIANKRKREKTSVNDITAVRLFLKRTTAKRHRQRQKQQQELEQEYP